MAVTPNPDEEPRCQCGALLTGQKRSRRRNTGLCRKCSARDRWIRREQARRHLAAERDRAMVAALWRRF